MTARKTTVRTHPRGDRPPKRLEAIARDFATQVRKECQEELVRDPKALRAAVLRLVRREMPLRRGRPNDPKLDEAMALLKQGKSVKEILRLQTSGFDGLDTYGRYLAEKGLRAAISRRRKQRLRKPRKRNRNDFARR